MYINASSPWVVAVSTHITGQLKPDDRLRIRELAAQVGTSVTPVRDAILQLAKEQALVLKTPRDIRVPQLTEAQFIEIRTLRLALEGTGAEQAAAHITPKMLEQIEENIRQNRLAIDEKNLREALRLNSEFHLFLSSGVMPAPLDRLSNPIFWTAAKRCWLLLPSTNSVPWLNHVTPR